MLLKMPWLGGGETAAAPTGEAGTDKQESVGDVDQDVPGEADGGTAAAPVSEASLSDEPDASTSIATRGFLGQLADERYSSQLR